MRNYTDDYFKTAEISNTMDDGITNLCGASDSGSHLYWIINWYHQSPTLVLVFQNDQVFDIGVEELNKLING